MMESRHYGSVGRSLCAMQQFFPGDVVVVDPAPFLRWAPEGALAAEVSELANRYQVPSYLAAAAAALLDQSASNAAADFRHVIRAIADMHAPPLPIGPSTLKLHMFCRDLLVRHPTAMGATIDFINCCRAQQQKLFGITLSDDPNDASENAVSLLVHSVMAAKTNAHRATNGDWCLYQVASKLAHSCDPNLHFVPPTAADGTVRFLATRRIATGELLSFSYIGGPLLAHSVAARRARLEVSHLFVCQCDRCKARDGCRRLPCPRRCAPALSAADGAWQVHPGTTPGFLLRRESPGTVTDNDAFPDGPWQCQNCQSAYFDHQLEAAGILQSEAEVETRVKDLLLDDSGGGGRPMKYADLKEAVEDCAEALGPGHWAFAALCQKMAAYYRTMFQSKVLEAAKLYYVWQLRYLDALATMGVEASLDLDARWPHMLSASAVNAMLAVVHAEEAMKRQRSSGSGDGGCGGTSPTGHSPIRPLFCHLCRVALPFLRCAGDLQGVDQQRLGLIEGYAADAAPSLSEPSWPRETRPPLSQMQQLIHEHCPAELRAAVGLARPDLTGGGRQPMVLESSMRGSGPGHDMHASKLVAEGENNQIPLPQWAKLSLAPAFDLWDRAIALSVLRTSLRQHSDSDSDHK